MSNGMDDVLNTFMCIPYELEVEGRPELRLFPLEVLFMKQAVQNGKLVRGAATYDPDLTTWKDEGGGKSLVYRNRLNPQWTLLIERVLPGDFYHAQKFHGDSLVGLADGQGDWDKFFKHLSLLGLAQGERCRLSYFEMADS